ncbi:lysosomal acid glucosylceramidase-like [Atheta coriaria]|uniref:lysosomal acid glucosylceramidase-like n=1 Tax=Dalotia coriaria TaxID=877792 RepID=UPI0031F36454
MTHVVLIGLLAIITIAFSDGATSCNKRSFGETSFVCACSTQSCDTLDPVQPSTSGTYQIYTSNIDTDRFTLSNGSFLPGRKSSCRKFLNLFTNPTTTITIDRDATQQEILGFGGAFTDATGINIQKLTEDVQIKLLESYFSPDGIEYNFGRVPMGGTDFSTEGYSYDDTDSPDPQLSQFELQQEDFDYKIPYIKQALEINPDLELLASTWTAPKWMKTNGAYNGGAIKNEYYQVWADYFLKFFEKYDEEGISFWGVTTGNEPSLALVNSAINSVRWLPGGMKWAGENLGPTIRASKYKDLKILMLDDQRFFLPWFPEAVMKNGTEKFIDGISVHWYWDTIVPASVLTSTHKRFPDKILLATEACRGDKAWEKAVLLGDWSRAEDYVHGIIQDMNHYVQGWIDWNLVLDTTGGPTYINNQVDAAIIVDYETNEFYKQPMFYAQGHFSKFIPRGSHKIDQKTSNNGVEVAAFKRPDGGVVVVVMNKNDSPKTIIVNDSKSGHIELKLTSKSINTILYW